MDGTLGVQIFLSRLKPLLEAGKLVFQPRNRRKTWEFMLAEGLTAEDAYEIIAHLKCEHHHRGPEDDHDGTPGAVCSFKYPYKSIFLYIKIKIVIGETGDSGAVLSFHDEGNYE
ncbi:MAG: hypothetical protein EWM51_06895 [Treponema sp.]|nr:MAG: hypothetical protein EWM51_06895 [Treponema sp.]